MLEEVDQLEIQGEVETIRAWIRVRNEKNGAGSGAYRFRRALERPKERHSLCISVQDPFRDGLAARVRWPQRRDSERRAVPPPKTFQQRGGSSGVGKGLTRNS